METETAIAKKRSWAWPWVPIAILIVGIGTAVAVFVNRREHQRRLRASVVAEVLAGRLRPDTTGLVVLPPELRAASVDGNVYVTKWPNMTFILLPTWRGKGSNLKGCLYTSSFYCYEAQTPSGPHALPSIEINGPAVLPAGMSAKVEIFIEKRLDQNWLRVSRSVD